MSVDPGQVPRRVDDDDELEQDDGEDETTVCEQGSYQHRSNASSASLESF